MLGKQGWRLGTDHNTIVSCVFKAKYFPNGYFMRAYLGYNPSYIWRNIHSAQVVVRMGSRWKVRNGQYIDVWKDHWLQGKVEHFVHAHLWLWGRKEFWVMDLIDAGRGCWNNLLIDQVFAMEKARCIKRMPLLRPNDDGALIWNRSRTGSYTVQSAYYMIMEDIIKNTHLRRASDWLSIWKLCITQKGKLLIWRVARDCLPIRCNLQQRHVPCPRTCTQCVVFDEDEHHVFFSCKKAEEVWRHAGLWSVVCEKLQAGGFSDVFFAFLSCGNVSQAKSIAMQLLCIWKRQNERVRDHVDRLIAISAKIAMNVLYY